MRYIVIFDSDSSAWLTSAAYLIKCQLWDQVFKVKRKEAMESGTHRNLACPSMHVMFWQFLKGIDGEMSGQIFASSKFSFVAPCDDDSWIKFESRFKFQKTCLDTSSSSLLQIWGKDDNGVGHYLREDYWLDPHTIKSTLFHTWHCLRILQRVLPSIRGFWKAAIRHNMRTRLSL